MDGSDRLRDTVEWNGMGRDGGDNGQRMMMDCNFVLHLRLRGIGSSM
jgi:hypothetical protein